MTSVLAITWLPIIINILLVVFVVVCLLMTLLILMQRPKQEGLGAAFGGGVTDQVFGASTTNVLQKGTVWLGTLFFVLSLTLAILVGLQNRQKKVVDDEKTPAEESTSVEETIPENQPAPKSLAEELPATEPEKSDASGENEEPEQADSTAEETPEDKSGEAER